MCEQPSTPQGSKAQTPSTLSSTPWREAPKISAPNLGVGNYHADGVNFAYEPVVPLFYLGQSRGPFINGFLNGYWELRAEGEFRDVTSAGVVKLKVGDYTWLGGTVRGHLFLFTDPVDGSWTWPSQIGNRISIIGTAQDYADAGHSTNAHNYSAEIQYKLSGCSTGDSPAKCATSDSSSSSVSFEYDWGTNKDTLVFARQYLVKRNYKY
jgi:hypothetical protein